MIQAFGSSLRKIYYKIPLVNLLSLTKLIFFLATILYCFIFDCGDRDLRYEPTRTTILEPAFPKKLKF